MCFLRFWSHFGIQKSPFFAYFSTPWRFLAGVCFLAIFWLKIYSFFDIGFYCKKWFCKHVCIQKYSFFIEDEKIQTLNPYRKNWCFIEIFMFHLLAYLNTRNWFCTENCIRGTLKNKCFLVSTKKSLYFWIIISSKIKKNLEKVI